MHQRVLATVIIGVMVALGACTGGENQPDPASLTAYAQTYVDLLNRGDTAGLAKHLANPAQPQDAAERITAYGRRDLRDVVTTWSSEFPPNYMVRIRAVGADDVVMQRDESIGWQDGHWVMGPLHARPTPGSAASTRTP